MKKGASFYPIVCYVDKDFAAKYIDRHKDAVPGLADAHAAVCAGKVPAEIQLWQVRTEIWDILSFRLIASATPHALMLIS